MVLRGINADGAPGDLFCINRWGWDSFLTYLYQSCPDIISEEDNDIHEGNLIDADTSRRIAIRLMHLLSQQRVKEYAVEFNKRMALLPESECDYCNGAGYHSKYGADREQCSFCSGRGVGRYIFREETVKEFVDFLRESDGFKVPVKILP